MVLLHHIIQLLALTETNPTGKNTFFLQRFQRSRIGRVLSTLITPGARHCRESSGPCGRSVWPRSHPVSRNSMVWPVESTARYRYLSSPLDLYIGLVRAVAFVRRLQMWAAAFVELGCVGLHPAPDAPGIRLHAAFRQEFSDVFVGDCGRTQESPRPGRWRPLNGL